MNLADIAENDIQIYLPTNNHLHKSVNTTQTDVQKCLKSYKKGNKQKYANYRRHWWKKQEWQEVFVGWSYEKEMQRRLRYDELFDTIDGECDEMDTQWIGNEIEDIRIFESRI